MRSLYWPKALESGLRLLIPANTSDTAAVDSMTQFGVVFEVEYASLSEAQGCMEGRHKSICCSCAICRRVAISNALCPRAPDATRSATTRVAPCTRHHDLECADGDEERHGVAMGDGTVSGIAEGVA